MRMRSTTVMALCMSFALLVAGCGGGGGGGGGGDAVSPTGSISGAVAGTTIMAVDESGAIVSGDDTADKVPDFDSDGDGLSDAFTFQLSGIPLEQAIRVYLVTGGGIYPMYYDSDGDGVPETNVFTLTAETTVDLGFVTTGGALFSGLDGQSVPEIDPTDNSVVIAGAEDPEIPPGLGEPDTSGLTLEELLDRGYDALDDGWVLGARGYFEQAVAEAGDSTSAAADEARFAFALVRIAALGFDTLSDGESADMNRLADILDRLEVANDYTRGNWSLISLPEGGLPDDSPDGNEYQDFLYLVVGPELDGAVSNLDAVSSGFAVTLSGDAVDGATDIDYGDVLFLRGVYKSMLAAIATQRAYDLDGDVDAIYNSNNDADPSNDVAVEDFLAGDGATFLSLTDASKLGEAKNYLTASALDDFIEAIDVIEGETDDQLDDLVTVDTLGGDPAQARQTLLDIKKSILDGPTLIGSTGTELDLQRFFDTGVDFRSPTPGLLPPFTGNNVSGLFPDPTFDGVVLQPDLNEDVDIDGVPDILQ